MSRFICLKPLDIRLSPYSKEQDGLSELNDYRREPDSTCLGNVESITTKQSISSAIIMLNGEPNEMFGDEDPARPKPEVSIIVSASLCHRKCDLLCDLVETLMCKDSPCCLNLVEEEDCARPQIPLDEGEIGDCQSEPGDMVGSEIERPSSQ